VPIKIWRLNFNHKSRFDFEEKREFCDPGRVTTGHYGSPSLRVVVERLEVLPEFLETSGYLGNFVISFFMLI